MSGLGLWDEACVASSDRDLVEDNNAVSQLFETEK